MHVHGERIVGLGVALPPDTSAQYGLKDVRGNDPPNPTKTYMRVFRLINPAQSYSDSLFVPALSARGRAILNLLDARYVVVAPGSIGARRLGMRLVYHGGDADVYRDPQAVGRAFIPAGVRSVETDDEAIKLLAAANFRPRREAVVQGRAAVSTGAGTVAVRVDRAERVALKARLQRKSLVVLTNAFDDGWRVEVDGRRRELLRVDGVLMGVVVAAGKHDIRWAYSTPGLREGLALSAAGIVGTAGWVAVLLMRRRRPLSKDENESDANGGDLEEV
jgi:hypothetical protein